MQETTCQCLIISSRDRQLDVTLQEERQDASWTLLGVRVKIQARHGEAVSVPPTDFRQRRFVVLWGYLHVPYKVKVLDRSFVAHFVFLIILNLKVFNCLVETNTRGCWYSHVSSCLFRRIEELLPRSRT